MHLVSIAKSKANTLENIFDDQEKTFLCPSDYPDTDLGQEAKMQALKDWTNGFYDSNPGATITDWAKARKEFYVENNCSVELENYEKTKNVKAEEGGQKVE